MKAEMMHVPNQVIKGVLELEMTAQEWREFAKKVSSIGSDCPFFPFKKQIENFVLNFVPRK